ncbi:putative Transmembrane protein 43 [Paratrimastix pyriformis]|uniref:Transmembrane protein 43 n=1 Tax=Paratrimastix pyriformis TaxID=342808 RepID=A0ABQ8U0A9_9EUKA|nr:putative Transmembrane protein 43 [Paratrimastix pyriformis]
MRVGRTTTTYRTAEQEARHQKCVQTILYVLAAIFMIAVPIGLYEVEEHVKKAASEAFYEIEPQVVPGATNEKSLASFAGHVVHVTGTPNPAELCDNDFGVCSNTFLRVQRNVEYCQWTEHYTEHKDRDNEGNTVTTRQYYYTLGWHGSPVSSLFFNQPFAHNNPQRNPFPSAGAVAASATVGPYTVPSTILARIDADRLLEPSRDQLRDFRESPAARDFQYIGRGYFYSPYQASTMSKIAQFAGRALEGSLDIQLGDFLKSCEAGDIRVHFKVADPEYVTVVAQQQSGNGMLNDAIASNGYHVGIRPRGVDITSAGSPVIPGTPPPPPPTNQPQFQSPGQHPTSRHRNGIGSKDGG